MALCGTTHHAGGATGLECGPGTHKQPGTDGTTCDTLVVALPCGRTVAAWRAKSTDGNHLHVAALQCSREGATCWSGLNVVGAMRLVIDVLGGHLFLDFLHVA